MKECAWRSNQQSVILKYLILRNRLTPKANSEEQVDSIRDPKEQVDAVSKVKAYRDYSFKNKFETMNVFEQENNSGSRINPESRINPDS